MEPTAEPHKLQAESSTTIHKKRLFNPVKSLRKLFRLHSKKGTEDYGPGVCLRAKSASDMQDACINDGRNDSGTSTPRISVTSMSRSVDCIYTKEVSLNPSGLQLDRNVRVVSASQQNGLSEESRQHSLSSTQLQSSIVAAQMLGTCQSIEPSVEVLPSGDEVFFDTVWTQTKSKPDSSKVMVNDDDLSAVCTNVETSLKDQAASHKRSVRPRNRRTLSMYQPYVSSFSNLQNRLNKNVVQLEEDLIPERSDSDCREHNAPVKETFDGQTTSSDVKHESNKPVQLLTHRRCASETPDSLKGLRNWSTPTPAVSNPVSTPAMVKNPNTSDSKSEFEQMFSKIQHRRSMKLSHTGVSSALSLEKEKCEPSMAIPNSDKSAVSAPTRTSFDSQNSIAVKQRQQSTTDSHTTNATTQLRAVKAAKPCSAKIANDSKTSKVTEQPEAKPKETASKRPVNTNSVVQSSSSKLSSDISVAPIKTSNSVDMSAIADRNFSESLVHLEKKRATLSNAKMKAPQGVRETTNASMTKKTFSDSDAGMTSDQQRKSTGGGRGYIGGDRGYTRSVSVSLTANNNLSVNQKPVPKDIVQKTSVHSETSKTSLVTPRRSLITRSMSVATRSTTLEEHQSIRADEPPWFALARRKTSKWTEEKV